MYDGLLEEIHISNRHRFPEPQDHRTSKTNLLFCDIELIHTYVRTQLTEWTRAVDIMHKTNDRKIPIRSTAILSIFMEILFRSIISFWRGGEHLVITGRNQTNINTILA